MYKLIIRLFILFICFIGCSKTLLVEPIEQIEPIELVEPKLEDDKLYSFLKRVKTDLDIYADIALKEDLVKFLAHFKDMNNGGKRYYLIERDNITRMIESSTQRIYSDYILLDAKGKVIYSRSNNTIFSEIIGRRVNDSSFLPNLLDDNYKYYISNPLKVSGVNSTKVILVCTKISSPDTFPGFAILQINVGRINSLLEETEFILDIDGNCLFANEIQNIDKPYKYFSHLELDNLQSAKYNVAEIDKKLSLIYGSLSTDNINWILVEEKNDSTQYKK